MKRFLVEWVETSVFSEEVEANTEDEALENALEESRGPVNTESDNLSITEIKEIVD